jgi:hypothetical protein
MGVKGGSGNAGNSTSEVPPGHRHQRFTMSGTADNGTDLRHGDRHGRDHRQRHDQPVWPERRRGVAIFISGDFGTLTMGDTDGGLDWAMTEVATSLVASLGDDETTHMPATTATASLDGHYDGQVLRYDYSFGDFAVRRSRSKQDDDNVTPHGGAFGHSPLVLLRVQRSCHRGPDLGPRRQVLRHVRWRHLRRRHRLPVHR